KRYKIVCFQTVKMKFKLPVKLAIHEYLSQVHYQSAAGGFVLLAVGLLNGFIAQGKLQQPKVAKRVV
ncbi:hypothetical protein Tco_1291637, partial [Tanacetum coccineum]